MELNLTDMTTDYDLRMVRYEEISNYPAWMFRRLASTVAPQAGDNILDLGAGYGAVTKGLLKANPDLNVNYHLVERSEVQLQRARYELSQVKHRLSPLNFHFHNDDFLEANLEPGQFNAIIAKMSLHEFSAFHQPQVMRKVMRLLAPGGKLYIWQTILDEESVDFYRQLMQRKDELAGFYRLARGRNFISEKELFDLFAQADFSSWSLMHEWDYPFDTSRRLKSEFGNNTKPLFEWNSFLAGMLKAKDGLLKNKLKAVISREKIQLSLKQGIYEARKL